MAFELTYHPEYKRNLKRWQMLYDFARAGQHVLFPMAAREVYFWTPDGNAATDGEEPERIKPRTRYSWLPEKVNSYLLSHERESSERYADRSERACHIPICKPVLKIYTAGVLRAGPKRGATEASELPVVWRDFYSDVDGAGTNIDPFVRDAFWKACTFGRVHCLTDRPIADPAAVSRQDEIDGKVRAYSYLVTPLDLLDWALDSRGNFIWVSVREDLPDRRLPGQERDKKQAEYHAVRVWDRRKWVLYYPQLSPDTGLWTGDPRELKAHEEGYHDLGEVPIATLFAERLNKRTLEAQPLINSLVDIDRSIFNLVSLLDEIDYGQTFSQLAIPDSSGGINIKELRIGMFEAFTFDAEGGQPVYIAPNPDVAAGLWNRIVERFHTARVVAGVSRGRAEFSKEERSAAAIGHESEEKHDQMTDHAEAVEEFERAVHRHVCLWEDIPEKDAPSIAYNRQFDVEAISSRLSQAVSLQGLDPGPVAMAAIKKGLTTEYLKRMGVPEADIASAVKDIDAHTKNMQRALETYGDQAEKDDDPPAKKKPGKG